MAPGYGISGIGYLNPGLGSLGLGSSGMYGSYDAYMPSSYMGMDSIFGGMGMYGGYGGMYGGYGMMNYPLYMTQMQNQMEQLQVAHAGNMHQAMLNYDVTSHEQTDSAIFQKIMTNGDVQDGVDRLYDMVRKGDQEGICQEYDRLEKIIYSNYGKEISKTEGKGNPAAKVRRYIEQIYGTMVSAQTGQTSNLRDDITRYGDGAAMNGFMNGFRLDHHGKYVDQTMNHIYGERIDHRRDKEHVRTLTTGAGYAARFLERGAIGAVGGAAAYGLGSLAVNGFKAAFTGSTFALPKLKTLGKFAWIGAAAIAIGDIIWQIADRKDAA